MIFFPSSIWSRKMSVEKNMAKARQTTKDLKYQIHLGNNDIQLFIKDNQNPIWTRVDLDKFGPVTDLPEELKDNTNNRPNNTKANNSNKRKDITPNKTDAKKTKEDHEDINTTSDKQNDGDNYTEDDLAATAAASMDTDIELVAEVKQTIIFRVTMIVNLFSVFLICSLNLTMQIISNTFFDI